MPNPVSINNELKAGNYYKRRDNKRPKKNGRSDSFEPGDIVLVMEVDLDDQDVAYNAYADREWFVLPINEFLKYYQYEPNGRAIRDQEFQSLIGQAASLANEINSDTEQLSGIESSFRPNLLPGRTDLEPAPLPEAEADPDQASVSLVRINPPSTTLEAATKWIGTIAERRDQINDKKDQLSAFRRRIEGLQKEQKAWMDCLTRFTDIANILNETIGNLNLYLGSGEEIVQLSNGEPASTNVPLSIRQLVLYMDEECALHSETGGIDARSISEFDEWLLADSRNLDQILPEPKSIICLKPRRKDVEYTKNAWQNSELNEANHETYILIRNGANLFRLLTGWQTGDYFFPTKHEFEQFEYGTFYDHTRIGRRTPSERRKIVPSDGREYTEMIKKIEAMEKHYSRALILLQGIVDRTGIFPELQNIGLNLMDITVHNQYLRFIHDGDKSKLLMTGRETFEQWQERINKTLSAGDRIIGLFNYRYDKDDKRTRSAYNGRPDTEVLYTLEKQGDGLKVMMETERSWQKNRISYSIYRSDPNVIAFDQITLEDADYFLTDRLSRSEYMDMFPLLRRVRDLKQIERNEERPFIDLLVWKAAEFIGHMEKGLEAKIREVIQWYKYKNKFHRSLKEDDQKAFRMILSEWKTRRLTEAGNHDIQNIVDQIQTDQTIFIGRRDSIYIRIERADQNYIFSHRTDFKVKDGKAIQIDRKEWKAINKEYLLWIPVFVHKDWETWPKGARVNTDFLTPAEFEGLLPGLKDEAVKYVTDHCDYFLAGHTNRNNKEGKEYRNLIVRPYRIDISAERKITLYYWLTAYRKGNNEYLHTEMGAEFRWNRNKLAVHIRRSNYNGYSDGWHSAVDTEVTKRWNPDEDHSFIYWLDKPLLIEMEKARKLTEEQKQFKDKQRWLVNRVFTAIREKINGQREETARQKYLDDHGDPRNWESFKERANIEYLDRDIFDPIETALLKAIRKQKLSEDSVFEGCSVSDIFKTYIPDWESGIMKAELDLEFIPIPAPETDDESEEDLMDDDPEDSEWEI